MPELKQISKEAVPRALAKAERYRLLNEPQEAESICRDVLRVDPENQEAILSLILALTDQFEKHARVGVKDAQQVLAQITAEYERAYYGGIICERWAKAHLEAGVTSHIVLGWLQEAMELYQAAEASSPAGNDDAILRWNSCARLIASADLQPKSEAAGRDAGFADEAPPNWEPRKRAGPR